MRHIYLIVNLILIAAVAGLAYGIFRFRPGERDRILDWEIPEVSPGIRGNRAVSDAPQLAAVKSKNIFSPARGGEPDTENPERNPKSAPPQFELVGICSINDEAGAIIDLKNTARTNGNKARRYYAVGENVYDGFILESVSDKSAVLKRKNEVLQLKIDYSRFAAEIGKGAPRQNRETPPEPPPVPAAPPKQRGPGMPVPGVNP